MPCFPQRLNGIDNSVSVTPPAWFALRPLLMVVVWLTGAFFSAASSNAATTVASYTIATEQEETAIDAFTISFALPVVNGSPTLAQAVARRMDAFRRQETSRIREYCLDGNDTACSGEAHHSATTLHADDRLFSIRLHSFIFALGSVHPSHITVSCTWTVEDGKLLRLTDLADDGDTLLKRIAEQAQSRLLEQLGGAKAVDEEWLATGTAPEIGNYQVWNVTAEGLALYFNEYQVASYVDGPQEILLPWPDLKPHLAPGNPAADLYEK